MASKTRAVQFEDKIIGINEVAEVTGYSATYIRNNIRKNPSAFPPVLRTGKGSRIKFRLSDVNIWIKSRPLQRRATRKE